MSIRLLAQAFELDLPPKEKLTLLALCDHADIRGRCWPSRGRLMRHTSLSESSIKRAIRTLEGLGIVEKLSTGGGASNSSYYQIYICDNMKVIHMEAKKGVTQTPLGKKGGHTDPEGGHTDPKRGSHRPPNHKEPSGTRARARRDPEKIRAGLAQLRGAIGGGGE